MSSINVIEVTEATFAGEIESHQGVAVLDLWAPWCGPCRMITPILEQLAAEYAGKVKVAKLDIDGSPSIAQRFGIRSIPTLLFFRDGQVVDTVIGAHPKAALARRFQALTAEDPRGTAEATAAK